MDSIGYYIDVTSGDVSLARIEATNIRLSYFVNGSRRNVKLIELLRLVEDLSKTGLRTDMTPTTVDVDNTDGILLYTHLCQYFKRSEVGLKTRCLRVLGLLKPEEVRTGVTDDDPIHPHRTEIDGGE